MSKLPAPMNSSRALVPVTPEARGAHLLHRFAPRALRAIARMEPKL